MARVVAPGCWHHVTQRGNRRAPVFFEESDCKLYLQLLRQHGKRSGVEIAGYCLMSNHVHLVAIPREPDSLAKTLGRVHNDYARWLNVKRGETDHVWQNRFYSCPLDERHRWEALRYVELNPVRAGLVRAAEDWPWSSASAHTSGLDSSGLLQWDDWSLWWNAVSWRNALERSVVEAGVQERIREATRTGRPAGSEEFIRELEALTHRVLRLQKPGPKPKNITGGESLQLGVS